MIIEGETIRSRGLVFLPWKLRGENKKPKNSDCSL
jgi:hypothetical protein